MSELKKQNQIVCLQNSWNFKYEDTDRLESKLMEKVFYTENKHKKPGVAMLTTATLDLERKTAVFLFFYVSLYSCFYSKIIIEKSRLLCNFFSGCFL